MKIHNHFRILTIIAAVLLFGKSYSQKVYIDENISYWYNISSELHINHNAYIRDESADIYLEITFNNGAKFEDYFFISELQSSYHTLNVLQKDTLNIENHIVAIKASKIFTFINIPNSGKADLVLFHILNKKTGINYVYDIPLIKDYNFSTDGLVFFEKDGTTPILSSFVNTKQALQLKSLTIYEGPVYGFYYSQQFEEAVPPMIIENQQPSKNLVIDSVFTVNTNETFELIGKGLYFFQKDSSTANGIGIRVEDPFFPLVKTFEEVLEPLIYISTRAETDAIRNAQNPRQAFEEYWINLVKVPSAATSTIREYYSRVEGANFLFTNFEEGWKSDMGLIYIIYGPPNDVYKSEEIIDWVYNRDLSMPTVRFSFYKVKNVFTEQHYTLLRKKTYDKNWFKSVELWREGKK